MNLEQAKAERLRLWRQDGARNLPDSAAAVQMIEEMGIVPLYAPSPEFPSLLLAHVGAPDYKAEASWDSPAGFVYGWRWDLGKTRSAFYSSVVAKKPTWISWQTLPTALAVLMERAPAEQLYNDGQLSRDGWQVYQALASMSGPMTTKELRSAAGFPTGKENRAAYLRAVEELETHLFLAKVFAQDMEGDEMSHGLVSTLYPEAHNAALKMDSDTALMELVLSHIAHSIYIDAAVFAKHLRLAPARVAGMLEGLAKQGTVEPLEGGKSLFYATEENS